MENDIFLSEIRSGFREPGGTPLPRIPSSTPLRGSGAGCKSCHHNHRLEYNVKLDDSVRLLFTYVSNPSPFNTAFVHRGNAPTLNFSSEFFIQSSYSRGFICGIYKNFTDLTNANTIFLNSMLLIGLKLQIEISSNSFFL